MQVTCLILSWIWVSLIGYVRQPNGGFRPKAPWPGSIPCRPRRDPESATCLLGFALECPEHGTALAGSRTLVLIVAEPSSTRTRGLRGGLGRVLSCPARSGSSALAGRSSADRSVVIRRRAAVLLLALLVQS